MAGSRFRYAAFCCALNFAHRARCADAIFLRAATDSGLRAAVLPFPRSRARLAFCAKDIFLRASAEIMRDPARRVPDEPFNDSIADIAWSNFSTCVWALPRSARSCCNAFMRLVMNPPSVETAYSLPILEAQLSWRQTEGL